MRLSPLIFCIMILARASSLAAEAPVGEWVVEDRSVNVRIEYCGGALWGVVSGELKPGQDSENPDPALRGRPILGIPILLNMKEKESTRWDEKITRWEGHIYNARNGKTYEANVRLGPSGMRLEQCELGGVFCGRHDWGRVWASGAGTTVQKGNAPRASTAAPMAPTPISVIAAGDVCSRVVNVPGRAH
jgi:uncharacterized protein (DUF2147 family)